MTHPTQILLHNPQALRVEYRLDDQRLLLWWSPRAGSSFDAAERNFSHRDNHLDVFERITLSGCGLDGFLGCDYDPYHCVLRFRDQTLHIALRHDAAAVFLWAERPLQVDFKSGWPHKLADFCRLALANPTRARGEGVPPGRMFAQLIAAADWPPTEILSQRTEP